MIYTYIATNCTTWDVRLAGGEDEMEGRVEMCSSYRWETVCGSQWTHNHTAVVCRHLGFSDEEGGKWIAHYLLVQISGQSTCNNNNYNYYYGGSLTLTPMKTTL